MDWNFKRFLNSWKFAKSGFEEACFREQNFRIELFCFFLAIALSFYLKISSYELVFIVISSFFVLVAELFNTAIERLTDLVCEKREANLAKLAKDLSSCAVLLAATNSVLVALVIFIPKFMLF